MNLKSFYTDIPTCFDEKKFPSKFINNVEGWGIEEKILHSKLDDGTYKLLTLDIDLGSKCSLSCPHCFKEEFGIEFSNTKSLTYNDMLSVIEEAKSLGLKSVKIVGAGDPFENKNLLPFLEKLSNWNIHTAIFTKGHIIGTDKLAKFYNKEYGINNSEELVQRLFELKTSILLGFNSFKEDIQLKYVGEKYKAYVEKRDRALKLLIDKGFNQYIEGKPTRLALVAAPIKEINIDEIFYIYKWGLLRNIYVATCPSTRSGLGHDEVKNIELGNPKKYYNDLISLYVKIYNWALNNGAITIDNFQKEGVSLYPGAHPCNQVAAGLYVCDDGKVMRCPGFDSNQSLVNKDVRTASLKDIWVNSDNYKLAMDHNRFNFQCIAREDDLTNKIDFYNEITKKITISDIS